MKIDPLLSLACSVQSKKGIYALLLGSGVSRASGIPTGWEITLDLIKKEENFYGETEVSDHEKWYAEKFNKQPDYSDILADLAKTPTERNNLLKSYFEHSDDDDDAYGQPTKAHKAIANLIKEGYIRVVITTNFDRLLEKALAEISIVPNVISNIDQLEGSIPLIHSDCTILKVHGDYMDTRIKNTAQELAEYDPKLNACLDCIFDEFGLIVCGWSGEWDTALKNCIMRTKNNRFSRYWLKKGDVSESTQEIIDSKKFDSIDITDADTFFVELKDKVDSLNDLSMRQLPLSIDLSCSTLKRLLPESKNIIRVNDLIMDTAKELVNNISNLDWRIKPENEIIGQRIAQIENISQPLLHLISLGSYWGDTPYETIWIDCFKYIYDNLNSITDGHQLWLNLLNYPALLVMYTLLMSCIKSNRYALLYEILNNTKSSKRSRYTPPIAISEDLYPDAVITKDNCNKALDAQYKTPVSMRMFDVLSDPLSRIINSKDEYDVLFDKAEYFFAVNYWYRKTIDEKSTQTEYWVWAPVGRFGYKRHDYWKVENVFDKEFTKKEEWSAIKAGFFGGSFENFVQCSEEMSKWLKDSPYLF